MQLYKRELLHHLNVTAAFVTDAQTRRTADTFCAAFTPHLSCRLWWRQVVHRTAFLYLKVNKKSKNGDITT